VGGLCRVTVCWDKARQFNHHVRTPPHLALSCLFFWFLSSSVAVFFSAAKRNCPIFTCHSFLSPTIRGLFLSTNNENMSYEMNHNQNNMAYPYPPPATTAVAMPPKSRFSKWWPISFFIAAILFFIVGGGLVGGWTASCSSSSYSSYYYSCDTDGMWYGAVACFALGGISKFVAWILFIVWCVKRSTRGPAAVSYTYQPLTYANAPVAPTAAMPAAYQNAQQQQQQGYQNTAFQNAPPYQPAQQPHAPVPAHSKEQPGNATKYCAQCGAGVTTPFCPNCGIQV
jgi:hypothetical protein